MFMGNNTGSEKISGIDFLQKKYQLNSDPGVAAASKRSEQRDGNIIPNYDYRPRVQKYLDRLSRLANPTELAGSPGFQRKERNIDMLKRALFAQVIIKPDEIPEGYFQSISKRNQDQTLSPEARAELAQTLIADQKNSLGTWVDYLTSSKTTEQYADWFKYFTLRSILVMGSYDKEKERFGERSKKGKNVGLFPELNPEALSFVYDALRYKNNQPTTLTFSYGISQNEVNEFFDHLKHPDVSFIYLYAWALSKISPVPEKLLRQTKGSWVTYAKGSNPEVLAQSLAQYGTGWCIRGLAKATEYLQGTSGPTKASEVQIYYSNDAAGNPVVPRVCVITRDNITDEVRGIAHREHLDPYIADVVEAKLKELPDGEKFKDQISDAQTLNSLHRKCFSVDLETGVKTYLSPTLTRSELLFIYELSREIKGFGYRVQDPRIKEIRNKRNIRSDLAIIYKCTPEQITDNRNDIGPNTIIYLGKLTPNMLSHLPLSLKLIFTSFPTGTCVIRPLEIGGVSREELQQKIDNSRLSLSPISTEILKGPDFIIAPNKQNIRTINLSVGSLGFIKEPKLADIYQRAKELGLELCSVETALQVGLNYNYQKEGIVYLGMKTVRPPNLDIDYIFRIEKKGETQHVNSSLVEPESTWGLNSRIIFQLPSTNPHADPSQT